MGHPWKKDMRERKCGCLVFRYGPSVLCAKHEKKVTIGERNSLRRAVEAEVKILGHQLGAWREYDSQPGKWTTHCEFCGLIAIVYDYVPAVGDQVSMGWLLRAKCSRSPLVLQAGPTGE